ncbi:pumilio homolog 3-like [Xenia sp. Carnegie-2017]|uniref:pumilio homolog 3-like n=1 Tax=Xenia sp. Carnegie-2017 TaxID=2897299 RepID=UPI001F04B0D3|nr:pumilio homolog 3-like [Xenia sp. Carnegie-2017]
MKIKKRTASEGPKSTKIKNRGKKFAVHMKNKKKKTLNTKRAISFGEKEVKTKGKDGKRTDNTSFKNDLMKKNKQTQKLNIDSGDAGDSLSKRKREDYSSSSSQNKKLRGIKNDEVQTRLDQKQLKLARRKRKQNYELTNILIKKYDALRRKDISSDKKRIMIDEVLDIIAGHCHEVVFKHDTVRVLQMCIKYGSVEQRCKFFDQFKDNVSELALKKYSKFFIRKMMKYGTKEQRIYIICSFNRKVKKYIRHQEAGEIVETIYNEYANSSQRKYLLQEFYGAEYSIGKISDARSLEEIIQSDPHKKPHILRNLKETMVSLIEKSLVSHTIVHRAMLEFFTYADEKMRTEVIECLHEQLVLILHTSEGAKITMSCLWHGTPKDRKVIVKSFKGYVAKICKEEYGHVTMLAIFDCVDDTVLVQKVIISEMLSCLKELAENHHGRKVLLYLLAPRSPAYFSPNIIKTLSQGDGNKHSQKESSVRRRELLSAISPSLIQFAAHNVKRLLFDKALSQFFVAIIHNAGDEVETAMKSAVKLASKELDVDNDSEEDHVFKSASGHFAIKQLIQLDKKRIENDSKVLFSPLLMTRTDPEMLFNMCLFNRGAFLVVSLLECSVPEVQKEVKQSLMPYVQKLKTVENTGVKIVMKLLKK